MKFNFTKEQCLDMAQLEGDSEVIAGVNKYSILFLDDDPFRHSAFWDLFSDFSTMTYTAEECIKKLQEQEWDIVCLDHDLGGEVFVDSSGQNTGMEVVRWIEKNKPAIKYPVVVHSWNNPAADEMCRKLSGAGYDVVRAHFGQSMMDWVKNIIGFVVKNSNKVK